MYESNITAGAKRLARWLAEKGMTNGKFGEQLGVSHHSVWRWTSGHAFPSFSHIERIAVLTDGFVKPDDWMSDAARAKLNETV